MKNTLPLPLVSVIIPCHNKSDTVVRSIESVKSQTLNNLSCIVLNDASNDNSEEVILEAIKDDRRFKYEKVEYRNVALVRNHGARVSEGLFLCFLDGDDWIENSFLEICLPPLLEDNSLGVTYTRLQWHKPDGTTGLSPWPDEFDYNMQLRQRNQIPTCSVIRRECWDRVGGQRARYSEGGAGCEDGECYLRIGACGWNAKKVTEAPLFNYSWMSGIVTGDPDYKEMDWTSIWHPWVQDNEHPFASLATPELDSHAVRQYDEPIISVVIPVGPGHEETVINALDSLEAQTFRKWEAIVVWDQQLLIPERLTKAYPYVKWLHGNCDGAGAARNRGAEKARASLLFFLDADDWLYPKSLALHYEGWQMEDAIIYSDYVGMAEVDDPSKLAPDLQESLYQWDGKNAVIGYKSAIYDCERAQRQPEPTSNPDMPYYHWCLVTCLIPKAWHDEIGGFDESMESWEDVDYHWRMAKAGKCYLRIEEELLVYQFRTGGRRDLGLQQFGDLIQYLENKYEEMEMTPCPGGCGGRKSIRMNNVPHRPPQKLNLEVEMATGIDDKNVVMIRYRHPNRGQHNVRGSETGRDYGYRGGGEMFLVEYADAIAAPHLFDILERPVAQKSPEKRPDLQPPPDLLEVEVAMGFDFQTLPGVNAEIAAAMEASGLSTREDVLALGEQGLLQYKHIGPAKAKVIIKTLSGEE